MSRHRSRMRVPKKHLRKLSSIKSGQARKRKRKNTKK